MWYSPTVCMLFCEGSENGQCGFAACCNFDLFSLIEIPGMSILSKGLHSGPPTAISALFHTMWTSPLQSWVKVMGPGYLPTSKPPCLPAFPPSCPSSFLFPFFSFFLFWDGIFVCVSCPDWSQMESSCLSLLCTGLQVCTITPRRIWP